MSFQHVYFLRRQGLGAGVAHFRVRTPEGVKGSADAVEKSGENLGRINIPNEIGKVLLGFKPDWA